MSTDRGFKIFCWLYAAMIAYILIFGGRQC